MDHIGKALEKARGNADTVRDWMKPVASEDSAAQAFRPDSKGQEVYLDPEHLLANRVIARGFDSAAIIDRYRLLRTRVQQIMRPRGWNVLGVTSPSAEAGKTLTSINLAMALSQTGQQHIYIIDADLRRSSVAPTLGFRPQFGLTDFLQERVSLDDVLYTPTDYPNLSIVPGEGSSGVEHPSELLNSNALSKLLNSLRKGKDQAMVIVDTPPIQLGDDVLAVSTFVDCFLLVVEESVTTVQEVEDAAGLLADSNLIGTVLNKSAEKPRKFESYYQSRSVDER